MHKQITMEQAVDMVKDGMTIMVGGFLGCGNPHRIIDKLVEKGVKDLTLICNDTSFPEFGVGKMVVNKQFKKIMAFTGQLTSQAPHSIQLFFLTKAAFILLISKTSCGHTILHIPQPVHFP